MNMIEVLNIEWIYLLDSFLYYNLLFKYEYDWSIQYWMNLCTVEI